MAFRSIHKKLRPYSAWLQCAFGTGPQNRAYCSKADPDFFESGDCPSDGRGGSDEYHQNAFALARAGRIDEIDPKLQIRSIRSLERIEERAMFARKLQALHDHRNIWLVGPPRKGKTSMFWRIFRPEDGYEKYLSSQWDNYKGEPVVHIHDIDESHGKWILQLLKTWTDLYPFNNSRKHGAVYIRPAHILVDSNCTIDEVFSMHPRVHIDAMKARFIVINLYDCDRVRGATVPGFVQPDCRCVEHRPELYPDEVIRRVLNATRDWPLEFAGDGKVNVEYDEDHLIWAHHAPTNVKDIVGWSPVKRPRRADVPPAADAEQQSAVSQLDRRDDLLELFLSQEDVQSVGAAPLDDAASAVAVSQ